MPRKILLVLLGTLLALVLIEIGLRVLGIRPERFPPPRWLTLDGGRERELGVWGEGRNKRPSPYESEGVTMGEYVPGARFKVVYASNPRGSFDADGSITYAINQQGLRGPEATVAKSPGTFRVLGLGDSFTFGLGVQEGDTFLRLLELDLNRAPPAGVRFEVLNAAVAGYNTRDEVIYLERRWLAFAPDLVLITFYLNDAYSDTTFLNMGQELALDAAPTGLARASYLADLVQHAWRARAARATMDAYYHSHYFQQAGRFLTNPGDQRVDWTVARAALARAARLAREHGFELALVLFPELRQLDETYPFRDIHRLVLATCGELGIPALDLLGALSFRPARELWVHPSDHHPNEIAHALAAAAIVSFLRAEHLVPE